MSGGDGSSHQRRKKGAAELVCLEEAYVVEIECVDNALLRALVVEFYAAHFPPKRRGEKLMAVSEAHDIWNRDPRQITSERLSKGKNGEKDGGGNDEYEFAPAEQAIPDVEQLLAQVMQQASGDFNARKHDMFKRHVLASTIKAQALVESWDEEAGVMRRWRVIGAWCTLSRAVPLRIVGKKIEAEWVAERQRTLAGQTMDPMLDATVFGGSISIATAGRVTGHQFFDLLVENGNFAPAVARALLERIYDDKVKDDVVFADEDGADAKAAAAAAAEDEKEFGSFGDTPVAVPRSAWQLKQFDADAKRREALSVSRVGTDARLGRRSMSAIQLHERCVKLASEAELRQMLRPPFIGLGLRAILLNKHLVFIGECYTPAVQIEMLARGPKYILPLAELLETHPEYLCIDVLRRKFATESGLRSLALLPDLEFEVYEKLVDYFELEVDPGVLMGIDIYHNVLRRDVHGYERFADAAGPNRQYYYSTGHMFTVFGVDPYDYRLHYYHDPSRPEASDENDLRDRSSLSTHGSFAVPWTDHSLTPAQVDFVALAESINTPEMRVALQGDFYRLRQTTKELKTLVNFLRGVYWLAHTRVVVLERFVGTGPNNAGKLVDAFFLADIYDTQRELVNCLATLTDRSRRATPSDTRAPLADPECVQFRMQVRAAEKDWRERYFQACKLPQGIVKPAPLGAPPPEVEGGDSLIETVPELARAIASKVADFERRYEEKCAKADGPGPYDDVRNKFGRWRWWPLQRVREYSRTIDGSGGKQLAAEQVATLERMLAHPIVVTSGPGGVGKSEVAVKVIEQYPADQVMCVGFTGKVASELARRTGHEAWTLHRVLYQLSLWLTTKYRARSFRRNRQLEREKRGLKPVEEFTQADVQMCANNEDLRAYVEYQLGAALLPVVCPFEHVRVLIIDELSLLAFPLFSRFLMGGHAPDSGLVLQKLYVFGDLNQLPPIGYGSIQSDFAHGLPNLVSQLVVNHRSSGTELFGLAQAIAKHVPFGDLPMPAFDRFESFEAVRANRGDIVALECSPGGSTLADDLAALYTDMGADQIDSARTHATQCIAATNDLVDTANAAIRSLYHIDAEVERFRKAQLESGSVQMIRTEEARRALNAKMADGVRDHEEKLRKTMQMQLRIGDRFYVRANRPIPIKGRTSAEPTVTLYLYNGELRRVVGFYDAPRVLKKTLRCRCGLCPPERGENDEDCMARLDVVPALRRVPPPAHERGKIQFHDQNLAAVRRHENKRRMMVTVNESGNFLEIDVADVLPQRSRFDYGFAVTIHKMQGSQNDQIVAVFTEDSPHLNWRDVYTALTRAKQRVIILSSESVFARLTMRKAPIRRSSLWLHLTQTLDPSKKLSLGQWPQPLLAADEEQRLWERFETIRNAPAPPLEDEPLAPPLESCPASPPPESRPLPQPEAATKKRKTMLEVLAASRRVRQAASSANEG